MKLALLALTGLFAASVALAATESFHQALPLSASGTVELSNVNGPIEVTAWDKPEVVIDAEKSARKEETLRKTQIIVSASPDSVTIRTEVPKTFGIIFGDSANVTYHLYVPANATLRRIEGVNGPIKVVGVHGACTLKSVNGRISATGLQGDASISLVNGSLELSFDKVPEKARIQASTTNGSVELSLPADTNARLDAETVNGSASCRLPLSDLSQHHNRLHGRLGSGSASIKASSVNGSVTVRQN